MIPDYQTRPLHTCANCGSDDVDVTGRVASEFVGRFEVGGTPRPDENVSARCRRCGCACYVAPMGDVPERRYVSAGRSKLAEG